MRHTKRTEARDDKFFKVISGGGTVQQALDGSTYKRVPVYDWRRSDPAFAERWEEANQSSIERLEQEADRRARDGWLEAIYYQGQQVGLQRRYSDQLLMFRLKSLAPDRYRENVKQEVSHTGGVQFIIGRGYLDSVVPGETPQLEAPAAALTEPLVLVDEDGEVIDDQDIHLD